MQTKVLLSIIIGIIIVAGSLFVFWYIPSHTCPASCDDKNPCTQDACSKETNYKCSYTELTGSQPACSAEIICGGEICKAGTCQIEYKLNCCGNKTCEFPESYESCPADCPNCDDGNKCTKDSYDYHSQKCLNAPILDVVCCGNTACETGETYTSCPKDCPNCDDENKCTKDKYDYHKQQCVNEVIAPCCGNKICDKGTETNANCSLDCPNCNDGNKLTADSFNYTTQKCENIVTHYFFDDFESGTSADWEFTDSSGSPIVWSTITEGGNTVLRGTGYWGFLKGKEWTDYIFKTKFKIIRESAVIQFNYRKGFGQQSRNRYAVGIKSDSVALTKAVGDKHLFLGTPEDVDIKSLGLGQGWHTLEIRGYGNILNVYIDNELLIKYKDTESPILSGGIAFEIQDGTEVLIDNVEIKVISESNIVYP